MPTAMFSRSSRRAIGALIAAAIASLLAATAFADGARASTRPCKISGGAGSSEGTVGVNVEAFPGDCSSSTRRWGLLLGRELDAGFYQEGWYETNYFLEERITCHYGIWDISWVMTGSEATFKCPAHRYRYWVKIGDVGSASDEYTITFKAKEKQSGSDGKISFTTSPSLTSPTWIGSSYSGSDANYGDKVTISEATVP